MLLYGLLIWLDSSSLTAGAAGSADPERRGATLALHSMAGYAGGSVGPIVIGWILDLSGGMSPMGWGLAFLHVAVIALLGQVAFVLLGPRDLVGDRRRAPGPIRRSRLTKAARSGGASGAARNDAPRRLPPMLTRREFLAATTAAAALAAAPSGVARPDPQARRAPCPSGPGIRRTSTTASCTPTRRTWWSPSPTAGS